MGDPQVFASRFWGFDPENEPIITFRLDGDRDALIRASREGDLLVFVGTQTEETDLADRGRLLGIAEIGRDAIEADEVIDLKKQKPSAFDEFGRYRWPKALPMLRAWRFLAPPLLTDVLQQQLPYEATVRAVLLDPIDTATVLGLAKTEIEIIETPTLRRKREQSAIIRLGGVTTGPKPTSWAGATGRNADEASFTYAFQFGKRDVWKIGHAKDIASRLKDVNRHVPTEVLEEAWRTYQHQAWPSEDAAHEMEQRVFSMLEARRSVGERIICTRQELDRAWNSSVFPK